MATEKPEQPVAANVPQQPPNVVRSHSRLPLWLKLLYSAFFAVLVPRYLRDYGPTNFLYFCDVALLMTFVALWTEKSLWASMPAVGITLPQTIWIADYVAGLFGTRITGTAQYMFSPKIDLFTRSLSYFHLWLPILLVGIIWKLGYDRRAFVAWTLLAWGALAGLLLLHAGPARSEPQSQRPGQHQQRLRTQRQRAAALDAAARLAGRPDDCLPARVIPAGTHSFFAVLSHSSVDVNRCKVESRSILCQPEYPSPPTPLPQGARGE